MVANVTGRPSSIWPSVRDLPRSFKGSFHIPVGSLADGSEATIQINVIAGESPRPVVVAVSGHHGDEGEGPASMVETWRRLEPKDVTGTVLLIPVLNLPAFRLGQRKGPDDGADINRIFPGERDGTMTSRIASAFVDEVAKDADFIASMHGWSAGYVVSPYVEYPTMTAVSDRSQRAAVSFGLPYLNPLDAGPGRLLTVASTLGIPIIEIEIGGQGVSLDSHRALYEVGVRRLLAQQGVTEGVAERTQPVTYVERVECFTPCEGILRPSVSLGDRVVASQPLADVYNLTLNSSTTVRAPSDGVVGILRLAANVALGQLVATIFHPIAEPSEIVASRSSHPSAAALDEES
jgi:N-alpha-acetyl-L-2,4-diaminobutyrate deacetylase